jgi:hypothetical protein
VPPSVLHSYAVYSLTLNGLLKSSKHVCSPYGRTTAAVLASALSVTTPKPPAIDRVAPEAPTGLPRHVLNKQRCLSRHHLCPQKPYCLHVFPASLQQQDVVSTGIKHSQSHKAACCNCPVIDVCLLAPQVREVLQLSLRMPLGKASRFCYISFCGLTWSSPRVNLVKGCWLLYGSIVSVALPPLW